MSGFCDYCLEEKEDRSKDWALICKHRLCLNCLDEVKEGNLYECPIGRCAIEENFCGLHNMAYVGYCVNEMIPICRQCIDAHVGHVLKNITELDEEVRQEARKDRTRAYKLLLELTKQLKDFNKNFDASHKIAENIEKGCVQRIRRIEEGLKLSQAIQNVPNNGLGPRPDLRIFNLPIRVELIRYLNDIEKYNEEQVRICKQLQEINEKLAQI